MLKSAAQARAEIGGLFNIAVTPFGDGGTIDYDAHAENLERIVDQGYDGILVGGQYGEFATMSGPERAELSHRSMDIVAGRKPVLLGAGGSEPALVSELVSLIGELGGLPMVTAPYVSEVREAHIVDYFAEIAPLSPTGILVYNMPETGHVIPPALLERLADIPGIVGIKQGDLTPAVVDRIAGRLLDRMQIVAASDLHMLGPLMCGFHGATSTNSSALPELIQKTYRALEAGDASGARNLHMRWYRIRELLHEFGQPQTTKAIMNLRGWKGGHVRSPLQNLSEEQVGVLAEALEELGIEICATAEAA